MKTTLTLGAMVMLLFNCSVNPENSEAENHPVEDVQKVNSEITEIKIDNLLRDTIALAAGVEVIMSYLEVPKNTTLPTHYHPGEEFVYVLEGSGVLSLKDQSDITVKAGDAVKVPLEHVHGFSTTDEHAKAMVFRVHQQGQPDRILIE